MSDKFPTPNPVYCPSCKAWTDKDHWYWMSDTRYKSGGKWRCRELKRKAGNRYRLKRKADRTRHKDHLQYQRKYAKDHTLVSKYKTYCSFDKQHGFKTVDRATAMRVMGFPCYYCGRPVSEGLDRRDSDKGHTKDNIVSCCEKCNFILGDIPVGAKEQFLGALTNCRLKGLLLGWVIPTKRHMHG